MISKITKKEILKLCEITVASSCKIWYYLCIQVDYAYSTKIGIVH